MIIKGLYENNLKEQESVFDYNFNVGDYFVQNRGYNQVLCKVKFTDDFDDFENVKDYNATDIFEIEEIKKVPQGIKITKEDFK